MKNLNNEELNNIVGGKAIGLTLGRGLLFGAALVFAIGVIDGFVRPLPCRR